MAVKTFDKSLRRLSEADLLELIKYDIQAEQEMAQDVFAQMLETSILVQGKKGRGKTLTGVDIGWNLRERFGRPVIVVGSKMGLRPEQFGEFKIMDEKVFRDELERINVAASETDNVAAVAAAFEKYGISILYATIIFDEANKLFEVRRSADKLVQLAGYFFQQQRHYHVTTVLLTPDEEQIDKRVRKQIDWKGRVYHNKYTDLARVRLTQGLDVLTFDIDGKDDAMHTPYYEMYDSWALLGYRQASLKLNLGEGQSN
jgi:hypothetical protein